MQINRQFLSLYIICFKCTVYTNKWDPAKFHWRYFFICRVLYCLNVHKSKSMFDYLTGNTVLHIRKERLCVICPFKANNKLWINCAGFVIMASLLSTARIVAEVSRQSIARSKIYILHL